MKSRMAERFTRVKEKCQAHGLKWIHMPFTGKWGMVKGDWMSGDERSWKTVKERIPKFLADGERVVIHCAAGLHRTGAVAFWTFCKAGCTAPRPWNISKPRALSPRPSFAKSLRTGEDGRIWATILGGN